jgi:uncharacterized protein YndB with AHSA1/START domain
MPTTLDTEHADQPRTSIEVERHLPHPPERVYAAWLDAGSAGRWLFATPGGEMVVAQVDARVGGRFNFTDRRVGEDIEHSGEYLELDPPRRIVFTFGVPKYTSELTTVTVAIAPDGNGGCRLALTHDGIWLDYAERNIQGWTAILGGLASALG